MKQLLILLSLSPLVALAQTDTIPTADSVALSKIELHLENEIVLEEDLGEKEILEIYAVSQVAEFKGGQEGLRKFVSMNLVYPDSALENGIEGLVIVEFVIDTSGHVINSKTITPNIGYGIEESALDVIQMTSGLWTPAMLGSRKVKVKFSIPLNFNLM